MRGTETIKVVRPGGTDWRGDPVGTPTEHTVKGCVIWPRTSTEDNTRGEVIIDGYNVFTPPDPDIEATDQIEARGELWEVEGRPGDYRTAGGRKKGVWVILKRVGA